MRRKSYLTSTIEQSDLVSEVYWVDVEANPLYATLSRSSTQLTLHLSGVDVTLSAEAQPHGLLESLF